MWCSYPAARPCLSRVSDLRRTLAKSMYCVLEYKSNAMYLLATLPQTMVDGIRSDCGVIRQKEVTAIYATVALTLS